MCMHASSPHTIARTLSSEVRSLIVIPTVLLGPSSLAFVCGGAHALLTMPYLVLHVFA